MKKTLAILVLLFANTLMFAHTLVPHHHHGEQTCYTTTHCADGEELERHSAAEHHDHSDKSSVCRTLQEVVPFRASDYRYTSEVTYLLCSLPVVLPQLQSLCNVEVEASPLWEFSQSYHLHHTFVASVRGLRAPPFC